MVRKISRMLSVILAAAALLPQFVWAAGGKAADLVVVSDTRVLSNPVLLYFADVYNTSPVLNGVWAVALTAAYGCFLGYLMDFLMARTGLDLTKRKIVEH